MDDLLTKILNRLPQLIWYKDLDCRYQFVNNRWEQYCGFSSEEALGRTDYELMGQPGKVYMAADQEVMRTNKAIEFKEYTEGTSVSGWLKTQKIPVHDDTGKVMGVVGIAMDITSKVEFEKLLEGSMDRWAALTNGA